MLRFSSNYPKLFHNFADSLHNLMITYNLANGAVNRYGLSYLICARLIIAHEGMKVPEARHRVIMTQNIG